MKIVSSLILIAVLFGSIQTTTAQPHLSYENVWQGDTPGRYHDWHTAANWSKNHVPRENEVAVIPDLSSRGRKYPVIRSRVEVRHIEIHSNAELEIASTGELTIASTNEAFFEILTKTGVRNQGRFMTFEEMESASSF